MSLEVESPDSYWPVSLFQKVLAFAGAVHMTQLLSEDICEETSNFRKSLLLKEQASTRYSKKNPAEVISHGDDEQVGKDSIRDPPSLAAST